MISREDFARAIDALFMELPGFFSVMTDTQIKHLPSFAEELREARAALQDPSISDENIAGTAAGLVNEYVHANWDEVITESYAFYVDMSGGQSHRHPKQAK